MLGPENWSVVHGQPFYVLFSKIDKTELNLKKIYLVYLVVEIGIFIRNILADKNQSSSEYIGSKNFEL